MINVIISENLYDRAFVESYVHGWPQFVHRAGQYPPERVEEITWVKKGLIIEAARLFATTKPAAVQWGVAIEQQVNSTDNNRLLMALLGITGNIDVPGGQVFFQKPPMVGGAALRMNSMLSQGQAAKRLGGDRFRLASAFSMVNPKSVWDAILEEKPYPVKMLFIISSNPLVTTTNAREVYRALREVGFLVVSDFFMTPTAELADIVLPSATWLEMDWIGDYWKRHAYILPRRKIVQVGECRSDHEMLNDLGHRVGQGEFWWDTFEDILDYILKPMGIAWRDFKEMDFVKGEVKYRKYEKDGFDTPTGKFELYSTTLDKMGYDPLPQYREAPESPVSVPDLHRKYPYMLITGPRQPGYFHSEGRQIPLLRQLHKDPEIEIHPETAAKEGIRDGDWVVIESPRGTVRQRAKLTLGIDPRVVAAQHGWWFPEKKDPGHGWDESNINILTDNVYEGCDPAMGAVSARTLLCKIYREKSGEGLQ